MLSIKTPNRKKVRANIGISRDNGFYVPPTAHFFDCKDPFPIPVARGPIIEDNSKRTEVLTRRGPTVIKMPKHMKREKYKIVKRDKFLPERQVSYSLPPYPYRTSEEERKQAKLEDIERNGQLVQLSNKTLNSIYDKFDLFTISDDILKKVRTGQMSKKDARASALLALSREIKNSLSRGEKAKVDKVIDDIKKVDKNLIPEPDEIGEVKDSPVADVSLLASVAPNYDPETFIALTELLREDIFSYNEENNKVNNVIEFDALANSSIAELEASLLQAQQDERLAPYRDTLRTLLEWYYRDLKPPPKETMVDEPVEEKIEQKIEEPVVSEPVVEEPLVKPVEITRKERDDEFYKDLSRKEAEFTAQVVRHIRDLTRDLENIIKQIDLPTASVETKNAVIMAQDRSKQIVDTLGKINEDLKEEQATLPDVEGEVKQLTEELQKLVSGLADRVGEASKKPVDVIPPPTTPTKKLGFLDELLGKKPALKKTKQTEKPLSMAEEVLQQSKKLKPSKERKLKEKPVKPESPQEKLQRELRESMTRRRARTAPDITIEEKKEKEVPTQRLERGIEELRAELTQKVGESIKDYGFEGKLTPDEEKALIEKGQKVGSKEDVWNGLAVQSARINGLRREDLTFHKGKVKSIRAVVGAMNRPFATRTKK